MEGKTWYPVGMIYVCPATVNRQPSAPLYIYSILSYAIKGHYNRVHA